MEETARKLPSSVQSVISNDDLLTEILVRLPIFSLVLFKSVSKRWLSLIKDADVTIRRKLDPLPGLILENYSYKYDFSYKLIVPLDIRIPICRYPFTFGPEVRRKRDAEILRSCNGLLLLSLSGKLYVCNPSITNMFKLIPEPDNVTRYNNTSVGGLKMAFDPTKSPHYKVIYGEIVDGYPDDNWVRIHTYSSETGKWSLCGHQFPERSFVLFKNGVYWNDAIYWLNGINGESKFFKLDIMNEHPVLTALQTPLTLDGKVHYNYSVFESRGCLLLVDRHNPPSEHLTIFEKGNMYSEWSVKYVVKHDDIIKLFPERWIIDKTIFCIVLGEREEDSFLVWQFGGKIVQHKIVSKTHSTISDFGQKGPSCWMLSVHSIFCYCVIQLSVTGFEHYAVEGKRPVVYGILLMIFSK